MNVMSRLRTWWKAVTRREELNGEIEAELAFHIESYADDLMQSGVSQDEAMRRARAELGGIAVQREKCRTAWGTRLWDELWADVRYGFRMLAKSKGFTAVAIVSLALGIGANTVIFTAAQHMLLDRLDVPHPEQLRLFEWTEPRDGVVESMWGEFDDLPGGGEVSTSFSYPVYQQLRRENRSLADIFAFKNFGRMTATVDGRADAVNVEMVSGNCYSALEVKPQLGRGIEESDDGAVGSGPVVTISDAFWSKQFGRSRNVIGKTILVNAVPMTIVGVNPRGFTGAYSAQESPDIFLPFSMEPIVAPEELNDGKKSLLENKWIWWVLMMGRLKPGIPAAKADAALNVQLHAAVHATMTVKKNSQIPRLLLEDGSRGQNPNADDLMQPVAVLMALAGFVLLLACANLANLLLARAGARQREMSMRLALGAGRGRILRQMMTESLMLSVAGGAAGLLLAWMVRSAIPRLLADAWDPPAFAARFSWPIFAFAAGISVLTGLIFGLAPAWQATRVQVSSELKDSGQTITHRRRGLGGKTIVVVQIALSMLLLVGAGLFVRTLEKLGRASLGFQPHHILLFSLQLPGTKYQGVASLRLVQQIEDRLAAVPGVRSVTVTTQPLIAGNVSSLTFVPEGQHYSRESRPAVLENTVGDDFFKTFGIPIIAGRGFNDSDSATSRKVVVVNESLVKKFFPNRNPIGTTVEAGWSHPYPVEIVGVSADAKYNSVRESVQPTAYMPFSQRTGGVTEPNIAVSTKLAGATILPSVRDVMASVDRDVPVLDIRTQDEQIAASLQQPRIFADLTAGFGLLALVLACVGIYGIMAYTVSRRTNEIGIRMALGAQPPRILRMVLREAWWLTFAGVIVGLGAALGMGRLIASMLYGLKPYDPFTLGAAGLLLALVAIAASWVPARRAASVDPMRALRHE
jgi:predicted permease